MAHKLVPFSSQVMVAATGDAAITNTNSLQYSMSSQSSSDVRTECLLHEDNTVCNDMSLSSDTHLYGVPD